MFSFHKPKVYRSPTGCCICRAKSSSSRFTDSKKYEDDFMECFQLIERRTGEICNACVLLVKRWKKLPDGCERNWRHVVDARAGPGTKSLTKFKSRNKKKLKLKAEKSLKMETLVKKKHVYIRGTDRSVREESPGACSDDIMGEDFMSDLSGPSVPSSLAPSPTPFDNVACVNDGKSKSPSPVGFAEDDEDDEEKPALEDAPQISSFLDPTYWKSEKVCCGTIFVGARGEAAVDPRFLKACAACLRLRREATTAGVASVADSAVQSAPAKSFSDSSSDSGYDESSNPGTGAETLAQFARQAASAAAERRTPRQSSPTTAN